MTQVQSDVDGVVHFQLTWYLLATFRRCRNLFFKVWLQIFRRRVPASGRCLQCPPIGWCYFPSVRTEIKCIYLPFSVRADGNLYAYIYAIFRLYGQKFTV